MLSSWTVHTGQLQHESTGLSRLSWTGQQQRHVQGTRSLQPTERSSVYSITPFPKPDASAAACYRLRRRQKMSRNASNCQFPARSCPGAPRKRTFLCQICTFCPDPGWELPGDLLKRTFLGEIDSFCPDPGWELPGDPRRGQF